MKKLFSFNIGNISVFEVYKNDGSNTSAPKNGALKVVIGDDWREKYSLDIAKLFAESPIAAK